MRAPGRVGFGVHFLAWVKGALGKCEVRCICEQIFHGVQTASMNLLGGAISRISTLHLLA